MIFNYIVDRSNIFVSKKLGILYTKNVICIHIQKGIGLTFIDVPQLVQVSSLFFSNFTLYFSGPVTN